MAPRKKKPEDELKAAKLEAKALELHLLENLSFAQIAQRLKLPNRMAAKRLLDRAEKNMLQEQTAQNYDVWRAKRLHALGKVIGEAWAGWNRSTGKKSKTTEESGYNDKGSFSKERTLKWSDAGDPRFLEIIKSAQMEMADLLGVAKGNGSGSGVGGQAEGQAAELIIRQNVYIPGLGHLTPELMTQLLMDIEARDDSPTD